MVNWGDTRIPDLFWKHCIPEPNTGCWLWTGPVGNGKPQIAFRNKTTSARRLAHELTIGTVPAEAYVMSDCGQLCCNPDHAVVRMPLSSEEKHERKKAASRAWTNANRHLYKESIYKVRYGIGLQDIADMLVVQGNACALCHSEFRSDRRKYNEVRIDHCHRTGKVRALLCHSCNIGMGYFGDDPTRLRAAADYLEQHSDEGN